MVSLSAISLKKRCPLRIHFLFCYKVNLLAIYIFLAPFNFSLMCTKEFFKQLHIVKQSANFHGVIKF